ncbi:MAG: glycosyltransferase family 39 protein [Elusimicrobiota bacterium]|nr:glycosyltransferase family 39 protein [Elusimicrobiota bacterium]
MKKYAILPAPFLYLLAILALRPWEFNFPLNDDWAYAIPVSHLLNEGKIILSSAASATQLTHILWGALCSKIFGFSFGVLRLSTLALSFSALFLFYRILEECGVTQFCAALGVLCLAFNPLFFLLGNSFMSDVPYMFWMLLSVYCYLRHLRTPSESWFWLGSAAVAAAYLLRQIGIFIPLAYSFLLFSQRKLDFRGFLKIWVLPALAVAGHLIWFTRFHGPTWASENYVATGTLQHITNPGLLFSDTVNRLLASSLETGFFLLPLTIGTFFYLKQFFRKKSAAKLGAGGELALFLFAGLSLVYVLVKGPMPHLENNITATGLGVLTVAGAQSKPSGIFAEKWFWNLLTLASALSVSMFIALLSSLRRLTQYAEHKDRIVFIFYVCIAQFAFSLLGGKFFDRYLIILLPWALLTVTFAMSRIKYSAGACLAGLALMAALSFAGVKDYLAWNAAKWEAGLKAAETGIPPQEIANGWDWNAYYTYERSMVKLRSLKPLRMIGEWEWQTLINYKAMTSFRPPASSGGAGPEIAPVHYRTPLSPAGGTVYLVKINQE